MSALSIRRVALPAWSMGGRPCPQEQSARKLAQDLSTARPSLGLLGPCRRPRARQLIPSAKAKEDAVFSGPGLPETDASNARSPLQGFLARWSRRPLRGPGPVPGPRACHPGSLRRVTAQTRTRPTARPPLQMRFPSSPRQWRASGREATAKSWPWQRKSSRRQGRHQRGRGPGHQT